MTVKRSGLGRNLSALLGTAGAPTLPAETKPAALQPILLNPQLLKAGKYQPRASFDDTTIVELAESIKQQGLLQPLLVRQLTNGDYEIIAGERRWRASKLAQLQEIPVIVHQVDDETAMAMALVENLQREDLNAMDQARAMHRLISEFNLTHQQIATLLSKSRTAVTNFLRLLNLHGSVRLLLENGDIDMGHARCLLMIDEDQQSQVAQLVVAQNLSVRDTETLVARVKSGQPATVKKSPPQIQPHFNALVQNLAKQLHADIKIKPGKGKKGNLVIPYRDDHNLETLLQQLLALTCQSS